MKDNYVPFLKWWLQFTLISLGFVLAVINGLVSSVISQNNSVGLVLISIIMGIFVSLTIFCGKLAWACRRVEKSPKYLVYVMNRIEDGWFGSNVCMSLGMLGTIIGFVMMLSEFAEVDIEKLHTVQKLIKTLGVGVGVALWTTFFGLLSSTLLRLQYYVLGKNLKND